jgi:monoamine oxidase
MEFLLSDAPIPTWWSQLPDPRPLLTGWLAGPAAQRLRTASADEVLHLALESLAQLLASSPAALRQRLRASYSRNWSTEPYSYGAYSYATVGAPAARAALAAPVANTLFFAGEGLHGGPDGGTVEAARARGRAAAGAMPPPPPPQLLSSQGVN